MPSAQCAAKPRVLMVLSYFYPFRGGAENQALLLGEAVRTHGIDVFVLTRYFKGLRRCERIRTVPVYRYIKTVDVPRLFALCYVFFSFVFMVAHRKRYDIIHCHILQGFHSPVAVIAGLLFNKRTVIKITSSGPTSDFVSLSKVFLGAFILKLLRRADRLIVTSSASEREALQQGFSRDQVVVIPNGVDTSRFKPGRACATARTTILCVGRLIPGKGLAILIDAFYHVYRDCSSLRLDIVGDGPERSTLEKMAGVLGISHAVVFHGEVGPVENFLSTAGLFVQPSLSEGMSNVMLEAMAAGLPVIATRTGAAPDVIQDGVNGILVDAGSAGQIRDAVQKIISDEEFAQRLGRQARTTVEACYSIESVSDRYSALYQRLIKA